MLIHLREIHTRVSRKNQVYRHGNNLPGEIAFDCSFSCSFLLLPYVVWLLISCQADIGQMKESGHTFALSLSPYFKNSV